MLPAEFKVFLYFSNEVRLALKQTGGVRGVQKGEETLRQTLSALHCTESSAEAAEELEPARYLPSDCFLFPAPPRHVPVCFQAAFSLLGRIQPAAVGHTGVSQP